MNFGAYQETPFLHVHLMRSAERPTNTSSATDWLSVELDQDASPIESGRRVVRFDARDGATEVRTEVNRA